MYQMHLFQEDKKKKIERSKVLNNSSVAYKLIFTFSQLIS